MLADLSRFVVAWVGEALSPTTCASCDALAARELLFCAGCAASLNPPAVRVNELAVAAYGGAAASAILRLKYGSRVDLAPRLGAAMARVAAAAAPRVDVVVPVPLHPRRLVERGFDQASLLAAPVARRLGVPRLARALVRTRDTPRQAARGRVERATNVDGAFACPNRRVIEGRRVLLVDDVRTTGATLATCAAALGEAGAAEVVTLVFASRDLDD